jgi:hypothetical protein
LQYKKLGIVTVVIFLIRKSEEKHGKVTGCSVKKKWGIVLVFMAIILVHLQTWKYDKSAIRPADHT